MRFRFVAWQRVLPVLISVVSLSYTGTSYSSTVTGTMTVTTTVVGVCTVTPTALAFSNYSLSSNRDDTTTIVVTCTSGTDYSVALDAGGGHGCNHFCAKNESADQYIELCTLFKLW